MVLFDPGKQGSFRVATQGDHLTVQPAPAFGWDLRAGSAAAISGSDVVVVDPKGDVVVLSATGSVDGSVVEMSSQADRFVDLLLRQPGQPGSATVLMLEVSE